MADEAELDAAERRGEERAATTLKVEYTRLNTFFADYTRNLSKGGTFIRTAEPLEVGDELAFVLTLPAPAAPGGDDAPETAEPLRLELTGRVKWVVTEAAATAESPAGMGIEFVFERDEDRERVRRVIADLMRSSLGERLADKLLSTPTD